RVIDGIKAADPACIELGVEFIEFAGKQPFGRILHANTARSLRQTTLTTVQIQRLRRRIISMLLEAQVPHEYHEYARLARHIGLGPERRKLTSADCTNPYVRRWVRYFTEHASENAQGSNA